MKLTYKILWIDDQIEDYIDMGIKSEFELYIDSLGFIPTVECFEDGGKVVESLKIMKYDLILSDYNIEGGNEQGDILIQKIRDGGIFTEILFYSAQPDFNTIAKNLYRDRVSFFSLIGDESLRGFREKTLNLINLTVSKIQELNNIRGLVMAETSELDNIVEEILITFLSNKTDHSELLRGYIIDIIIRSSKDNLNISNKLMDSENITIVKSRIFDADKKSRALNKMLEIIGLSEFPFNEFYKNYKEEVLNTRNDLAHAKSTIIDGIEYLIISRKDGEHSEKFDQNACIKIRKELMKHSAILKEIQKLVLPTR